MREVERKIGSLLERKVREKMTSISQVLLILMIIMNMTILFFKPQHIKASANSWEININNTAINQCLGSDNGCLIADHVSRMLINFSKFKTPPSAIAKRPSVSCPPRNRYTGCLDGKKNIPGKPKCDIYNRAC
ncbi:hypothetical protein L6164_037380 [Bauhinia variegata]|uniref:Uncharacterized protein n=1 Tax=Bauhinia variegata TaxID=167791 RepID=A0ACB9KK17_BAUVA|nr:hypothetical protein L6164_037380 [Bauhinia variegata]